MFSESILFLAVSLAVAPFVADSCAAGEATELVIENSPEKIPDGDTKAELRGVRIVTTSPRFLESASDGVTVPADVVIQTVKDSPELQKTLNLPPDSKVFTFPMIAEAARSVQGKEAEIKPSNQMIAGIYCGVPKG